MTLTHGFELVQERNIPELNSTARLYRHAKTGARLLSMINDDENKVFGINFCTPPETSNGIAHIMEHSVLCGSRKYPVKEPFVELLKGSMKTFLNAFTFPDKTCYPVASTNNADFYNLIDVYLDAVFYPRITPHTLEQEGWHYELESADDPLIYKGVVFNEMKGAYASPDNMLYRYSQQSLFPDTTYGVDSGGDPREIPNLHYDYFKHFHNTYYHPSNAYIWMYGDDDPEERLRLLNTWLDVFEPINIDTTIALQAPFSAPQRMVYSYSVDADDKESNKAIIAVNWALPETTNVEKMLALQILSHILIGTPAAPLRKALIDSGLGEDITGVGLEADIKQMMFGTGLKGITVENADAVENLIDSTLQQLIENGIDQATIEASLNTIEFSLREQNTGGFPRGIALMISALSTWLYNGDPFAPLAFETPLNAIKANYANDPRYFESLIKQYLIDNTHRATVLLKPDPELQARLDEEERDRLAQVRESLSDAEIQAIIDNTRELKRLQTAPDSPEALATIPSLELADIDKENKITPIDVSEHNDAKVVHHDLFTNGIAYIDAAFDLQSLPQELLPYVPLFSRALLQMGTNTENFVQLSQRIGRKTGGIRTSYFSSATFTDAPLTTWLVMRGKSTIAQTQDLLDIMRETLLNTKFDDPARFRQLVLENKASHESHIVPAGHNVTNTRLQSHFTPSGWVNEQLDGISQLVFLRTLAEQVEKDWGAILEKLEAIRDAILQRANTAINITVDAANWTEIQPQIQDFIATLPNNGTPTPASWTPNYGAKHEGLTIPAPVNYVGKGANIYEHGYKLHGSASVISNYLRTTWLWDRIRVQGGAYGGFCVFDQKTGIFSFLSYRDPNLTETIKNYDGTADFLRTLQLDERELTRAIIGTISSIDSYQLPDAKGYTSFVRHLIGETDERRQQIREEVLSTTAEHFSAFAEILEVVKNEGHVVVIGSQNAIDNANTDNWMTVTKAL